MVTHELRSGAAGRTARLRRTIAGRLAGPGGYYNVGNALGLVMGIALQVGGASEGGFQVQTAAAIDYLAGNAAAVALTLATAVFFWSGEVYHRAWEHGFPPNEALNRRGDFLSGIGALALGAALFGLGQPLLAATAGLLHAAGKFGSACRWSTRLWPAAWPDLCRSAVLASRLPALLAALIELANALARPEATWPALLTPLTLAICYLLWAKADLLLFEGAKTDEPARGGAAAEGRPL